jgi:hypothetical protein
MAEVRCEISNGLRASEATVTVADYNNHRQCLRTERDFLTFVSGQWFLPIGVVYDDRHNPWVLIELPHEADSGANRLWVRREDLRPSNGGQFLGQGPAQAAPARQPPVASAPDSPGIAAPPSGP